MKQRTYLATLPNPKIRGNECVDYGALEAHPKVMKTRWSSNHGSMEPLPFPLSSGLPRRAVGRAGEGSAVSQSANIFTPEAASCIPRRL
jgi:hypothetical protein